MGDAEPAAVLTLGGLRLSQTARLLRASAAAEDLAVRDPALLASTGLWRSLVREPAQRGESYATSGPTTSKIIGQSLEWVVQNRRAGV